MITIAVNADLAEEIAAAISDEITNHKDNHGRTTDGMSGPPMCARII